MTAPKGGRSVVPPGALIVFATALGVAYGFAEAAEVILLGRIPGILAWRNGNALPIVWVAPLWYGILGAIMGGGAAALSRGLSNRAWDVGLVWMVTAGGAYLGLILPGLVLEWWAAAVLGVGIGTQITRMYSARRSQWFPAAIRFAPRVIAAVPLAWMVVAGGTALRERLRMPDPATAPDAPNVLLLVMDTQRADHLSGYGYQRPTTPRLDAFADEGMLFERAYASSSWTLPTHATMFTGELPPTHRAGVIRRPYLDAAFPTLAEELREAGYATAGFVSNGYWCGRQTGLHRGFVRYEDFYGNVPDAVARTVLGRILFYDVLPRFGFIDIPGRKRADDINRDLLDWVDELDGRPFFAFANYFDVHGPYLPPDPYRNTFSSGAESETERSIQIGALSGDMPQFGPEQLRAMRDGYDNSLRFLDAELGALFDALRARDLLDNTIVIVTSDHGESFGEHGMVFHGHSLYLEQIAVPLIIRYPDAVAAGARNPVPVGLEQLPATVMELVGRPSHPFPGAPFAGLRGDSVPNPDPVVTAVARRSVVPADWPTSRGWVAALLTDRWHFILEESGNVELYDLEADPGQLDNLAGDPSLASVVADFRVRAEAVWSRPPPAAAGASR